MQDFVDETDLALLNALQVAPRASWTVLGRALDLDAATVARRWRRLQTEGYAWVTCGVGPPRHNTFCLAYIEIECAHGQLDVVQDTFAGQPEVVYIHHVTGYRGLLIVVARRSPVEISAYIRDTIEPMPGIRSFRAEIRTAGHVEPGRWRLRSLDPDQQRALDTGTDSEDRAHNIRLEPVDQRIYQLLHEDGRMSYTAIAERTEISEPTARRRTDRLLSSGILRLRCEVVQSVSGWPVSAVLWAATPPKHLESTVQSLSALPQVRLCCSLTGPRNLLLMVWLRSLDALPALERTLQERAHELTVVDRAICLHTAKQLGRLLNRQGRATAHARSTLEAFPVL